MDETSSRTTTGCIANCERPVRLHDVIEAADSQASNPLTLAPHANRRVRVLPGSTTTAKVCSIPAVAEITLQSGPFPFLTCTGECLSIWVPSPNWPLQFDPQAKHSPSLMMAMLWFQPAATAQAPRMTLVGVDWSTVVPLPTWPYLFVPQ